MRLYVKNFMKLYIIRHGQTDGNAQGIIQGRTDYPLNATGKNAAKLLANYLEPETITAIYTSPLARAYETAASIAQHKQLKPISDDRLLAGNLGVFEGQAVNQAQKKLWDQLTVDPTSREHAGESFTDIQSRVQNFVEDMYSTHQADNIVIVTHHMVKRIFMQVLLHYSMEQITEFYFDNTALTILDVTSLNQLPKILLFNSTQHLEI